MITTSALKGTVTVPGDKSISHRSVMFGALARGITEVSGFLPGADCLSTISCFEKMGVRIERNGTGVTVYGNGMHGLRAPSGDLDCGNSGTTTRLISGILAPQAFTSVLTGDDSIKKRPMDRIIKPLRMMGADIRSLSGNGCAPLEIRGRNLSGITYESPVASAQVKSAILLAGLYANGETTVTEPSLSRDHTERMLRSFGAEVRTTYGENQADAEHKTGACSNGFHAGASYRAVTENGERNTSYCSSPDRTAAESGASTESNAVIDAYGKPRITVKPAAELHGCQITVPGDISSAAYFIAGALMVPGSDLVIKNVGINPTRDGILEVIRMMGGYNEIISAGHEKDAEPAADLHIRYSRLRGTEIGGSLIPRLIDELPIIAAMACAAEGTTIIRDAAELKVKESNRIRVMTEELRKMGASVIETEDGMIIQGGRRLSGARIETHKDHRIAMTFSILSLLSDGPVEIMDRDCVNISYPAFYEDLSSLLR